MTSPTDLHHCDQHARWCIVLSTGEHVDAEGCPCHQTYRADCPIDEHRAHVGEATPWSYTVRRRDHLRLVDEQNKG